jgi:hypothetical protein
MIILRIPPLPRLQYLRNNLPLPPLLINLLRHLLRDLLLLIIMIEDPRSILASRVWPLSVRCSRVVHSVEVLQELAVGDLGGVVVDLEGFGV